MNELEKSRYEIDQCDKMIVENFEKRMKIVMDVLDYKRKNGLPIFQPEREKEVIKKVLLNKSNNNFSDEIKELYIEVMRISRKLQSKVLFPYNIVLIGFMGVGKTSVAKNLSKKLEMNYIDIDYLIKEKTNRSIQEIFDRNGEDYFRKIESDIIKELSEKSNTIISCGGGVVLQEENMIHLNKNSKVILLKASSNTILKRLKHDQSRPLLKGKMNLHSIENMLNKRESLYNKAAQIIIDTDNKSLDEISKEIIKVLLV